jgi:hypothetical protein
MRSIGDSLNRAIDSNAVTYIYIEVIESRYGWILVGVIARDISTWLIPPSAGS